MLPVFLPPLSTICLLCLILLFCGKASKKREDMQGVHEGITTTAGFPCCFCTPIPNTLPTACSSVCLHVLDCLVTVCAWWPACTRCSCFLLWLGYLFTLHSVQLRTPLSISLRLYPVSPPLRAITCKSFLLFLFLLLFLIPHSFYLSSQLFIHCVNNCLPTVVIAPPCQPEVWSKWQCAQFSLAYNVQFLVSLVPITKNLLHPVQPCAICEINFWVH